MKYVLLFAFFYQGAENPQLQVIPNLIGTVEECRVLGEMMRLKLMESPEQKAKKVKAISTDCQLMPREQIEEMLSQSYSQN